ncbi:MAG: helix-turn-helix transcriptional regulator [Lachnospiraceae bacterium]|nr:helix-turn-helix transcriptional regulator [Lachnospiraceae bacterium]
MHAYSELYLGNARRAMASMLQNAVYAAGLDLKTYYDAFLHSTISKLFETGVPRIVSGKSGVELMYEVLEESGLIGKDGERRQWEGTDRTPEYWTGYSLAYYQWSCGLSFSRINEIADIDRICSMYNPYHEMDITKFVDRMEDFRHDESLMTRLKKYRELIGLSQGALAEETGISVRTIQNFEQRRKDINKAAFDTVVTLSRALHCKPEDLME